MSIPEEICAFQSHVEAGERGMPVAVTVCRTHNFKLDGHTVTSTVTEEGAYTLCPIGRIEYSVQQGIERLTRKLEAIEARLKEAFPERS